MNQGFRIRVLIYQCLFDTLEKNTLCLKTEDSVAVPHYFDADPDPPFHFYADPDPTFHFDAEPDLPETRFIYTLNHICSRYGYQVSRYRYRGNFKLAQNIYGTVTMGETTTH
jgi:hypothetical protein